MRSPAGGRSRRRRRSSTSTRVVLDGRRCASATTRGEFDVRAGQAVIAHAGEWVQYSTPDGAEYIAVCLPAFSPDTVHRDDD